MSNCDQNSNRNSNGKMSDNNLKNDSLNQGKILSPKINSLIDKID